MMAVSIDSEFGAFVYRNQRFFSRDRPITPCHAIGLYIVSAEAVNEAMVAWQDHEIDVLASANDATDMFIVSDDDDGDDNDDNNSDIFAEDEISAAEALVAKEEAAAAEAVVAREEAAAAEAVVAREEAAAAEAVVAREEAEAAAAEKQQQQQQKPQQK